MWKVEQLVCIVRRCYLTPWSLSSHLAIIGTHLVLYTPGCTRDSSIILSSYVYNTRAERLNGTRARDS